MLNVKTIVAIWRENMLRYLSAGIICSADIICSEKRTVNYEEQIMHLSMLSCWRGGGGGGRKPGIGGAFELS